jgi:2-keto-3-deoxy-6-phosphogluconate aldolase
MTKLIVLLIAVAFVFAAGTVVVSESAGEANTADGANFSVSEDTSKEQLREASGRTLEVGGTIVPTLLMVAFLTGGLGALTRVI